MGNMLQFEAQLTMRNGLEHQQKLKNAKAAIAGLGGLGSNIAVHLARAGVGELLLVDFDVVELSNLNRQSYFLEHVGQPKTKALQSILLNINPYLKIETQTVKICGGNAVAIFGDYDYVCEAFDGAEDKAMLVNALLAHNPAINMVCGSGMAGMGCANAIVTQKALKICTCAAMARPTPAWAWCPHGWGFARRIWRIWFCG